MQSITKNGIFTINNGMLNQIIFTSLFPILIFNHFPETEKHKVLLNGVGGKKLTISHSIMCNWDSLKVSTADSNEIIVTSYKIKYYQTNDKGYRRPRFWILMNKLESNSNHIPTELKDDIRHTPQLQKVIFYRIVAKRHRTGKKVDLDYRKIKVYVHND